jgi:Flp pilus assembly pilin Flp
MNARSLQCGPADASVGHQSRTEQQRCEVGTDGPWTTSRTVAILLHTQPSSTKGTDTDMDFMIFRTWIQAKLAHRSERGANLVEYLLLLAFIAIIVLVAVKTLGGTVSSKFSSANAAVSSS